MVITSKYLFLKSVGEVCLQCEANGKKKSTYFALAGQKKKWLQVFLLGFLHSVIMLCCYRNRHFICKVWKCLARGIVGLADCGNLCSHLWLRSHFLSELKLAGAWNFFYIESVGNQAYIPYSVCYIHEFISTQFVLMGVYCMPKLW